MRFEWGSSLKFRITAIFAVALSVAFCINWFVAIKTIHAEKAEDVEKVLRHLLVESTDEYLLSPLTPQSDLDFLYKIPHIEMLLSDSEVSRLNLFVSEHPHPLSDTLIVSSIRLPNGYYFSATSDHRKIDHSVRRYAEKLLSRFVLSLFLILVIVVWILDHYMKPLGILAGKTREWRKDTPFDLEQKEAATEIREVSSAFAALVKRLEAYRQKEAQLFKEAAHELKTPLALMRSRLDVYEANEHYEKERFVKELAHDIERLSGELKNVLFLESSDFEEPVPLDLKQVFEALVRKMEILIERKHLSVELPASMFMVSAPEKLLRKVLGALLENAITYATYKSAVQITAVASESERSVSIHNTIGNEKYLFSSKIGEKMLKRLSLEVGFGYQVIQTQTHYTIILSFPQK